MMSTIVTGVILLALVGAAVTKMVRDKKRGKGCGCGSNCCGCTDKNRCKSGKK